MKYVKLRNAQALHAENPHTFEVPTTDVLNNLDVGDDIKVCDGDERFWCKITEVHDGGFIAMIDNKLFLAKDYDLGDEIIVRRDNIYDVYYNREGGLV